MRKTVFFILIVVAAIVLIVFLVRRNEQAKAPEPSVYVSWNAYESEDFSLYYPKDFTVVSKYRYEALGPGKEIPGIAFTIPTVLSEKTNLSSDTKVSVEKIPNKQNCTPVDFLTDPTNEQPVTDRGVEITMAQQNGAAAGNRYDEIVYVYPDCRAVRYFIHSTNIQNYDPGTVQEFDRGALLQTFDLIHNSIIWQ